MTNFETFNAWWSANFDYPLLGSSGEAIWAEWVNRPETNVRHLIAALEPLAQRYGQAVLEMRPANKLVPNLAAAKAAYYAELRRIKAENDKRRFGEATCCPVCRGSGKIFVLSPLSDDGEGKRWPEDFRTADWAKFRGTEITPCPECAGKYDLELKHRILENGLPLSVIPTDRDWPSWVDAICDAKGLKRLTDMPGDAVITGWMRHNYYARKEA